MESYYLKRNLTGKPNIKKEVKVSLVEQKWETLSLICLFPNTLIHYNPAIFPWRVLIIFTLFAIIFMSSSVPDPSLLPWLVS